MKKVTSADSIVLINHYKNLLASEGIESFVKNEHMGSVMGEIPFMEIWPELWVKRDLDYDRALQLIDADNVLEESSGEPWQCLHCGEDNEPQFAVCWNCGKPA
jgi:MinD superfamily P-loop ATPase